MNSPVDWKTVSSGDTIRISGRSGSDTVYLHPFTCTGQALLSYSETYTLRYETSFLCTIVSCETTGYNVILRGIFFVSGEAYIATTIFAKNSAFDADARVIARARDSWSKSQTVL